jgi:hypothetical protein
MSSWGLVPAIHRPARSARQVRLLYRSLPDVRLAEIHGASGSLDPGDEPPG